MTCEHGEGEGWLQLFYHLVGEGAMRQRESARPDEHRANSKSCEGSIEGRFGVGIEDKRRPNTCSPEYVMPARTG